MTAPADDTPVVLSLEETEPVVLEEDVEEPVARRAANRHLWRGLLPRLPRAGA